MLEFMLIAAPGAIVLSAIIKIILLSRGTTAEATSQALTYTVNAESGYHNSDNRYSFTLKRLSGGWRCYIDHTPSYRGRSTDPTVIHRLHDSRGPYICYTANLPELEQAKTLCRTWSNLTQRYIETGKGFNE